MANDFDVIVIGGGPGGYVAAIRAAQLGLKTACIEGRAALGGTCLNVGCIPSKALLESSHLYHEITHEAKSHGIKVKDASLDLGTMIKRKEEVVRSLTKGIEGLFKKNKIAWLQGFGSFDGPGKVKVKSSDGSEKSYTAKTFVIATGSEPVELKIAPFDGTSIVSSTEALAFDQVPDHLVVIGGGYIGLEMGSVWARLGAKVSVVEAADKLVPAMDSAICAQMKKVLEKQGLEFHLGTKMTAAEKKGKKVRVTCVKDNGEPLVLECDKLLICVGRKPYTKALGLETIGLATRQDGKIETDKHFKTKVDNVYAIGDVIDGPMLAHKAEDEGMAVAEIIAGKVGHVNYDAIPGVVYTWPEMAAVGITEDEAKKRGIAVNIGQVPFIANGRAKAMGDTDGFIKVIADATTDRILGVHMIGPNVSELIAEAVVALEFKASSEDLARSTHAHPTLSEVMKEACLAVEKRAIHF